MGRVLNAAETKEKVAREITGFLALKMIFDKGTRTWMVE